MTVVFKVSENIREQMVKYYQDKKVKKTPPYSLFQATEGDTVITLYTSDKVVFQGISADVDANMWIDQEKHLNNRDIQKEIDEVTAKKEKVKEKIDYSCYNKSTIGSDEVGTGDYFGPIVVTASFVSKKKVMELADMGVRDSKRITDEKIMKIAPILIKEIPHVTYILSNKKFNDWTRKGFNMNKIKAILHNKVLTELQKKEKFPFKKIVIDQFVYPAKYFEYIKSVSDKTTKITFMTHAEDVCLSVAASSVISRYIFLNEMDKLSKKLKVNILKGASNLVDSVGVEVVKKYGIEKLNEIAKINFKNTDKIKEKLNIQ